MNSIFNKFNNDALKEYLNKYVSPNIPDLDITTAYNLAVSAIKYYRGDKKERNNLRGFQELENKWYKSLEMNNPDYSVYDDTYVLSDIWACWVVYSRGYLRALNSPKSLGTKSIVSDIGRINTIVDMGCGIGYTTAGLKELFPYSNVYGTNVEGSCQYRIATQLGSEYNFKIIPNIYSLAKKVDMVFASEYFEHIENSCEHLIEIIDKCEPNFILTANSFNTISLGHFRAYKFNGKKYNGKTTSNLFGKILRSKGYTNIKTSCWNSRPTYWKKN